jgi:5-methylcytosine-specific restriction enzyme A
MRNPKWHRDEIILALDLYLNPYRGTIDASNPNIIELSELLNKLPIFDPKSNNEKFRNPNGVSLKMSNFLAIDPNYQGKGMSSYSKLDKEVFDEFYNDRPRLIKIARIIKGITQNSELTTQLEKIEDDESTVLDSVQEGQVLYKLHKYRERNYKISEAKKKTIFKRTGKLECEVCTFDFNDEYGELGKGFIECHHTKPLSSYAGSTETSLDDLALVCSNCHRMLHRKIDTLSIERLKIIKDSQQTNL